MPQEIEIPGRGVYEFPDGMSDEEIQRKIRQDLANPSSFKTYQNEGWESTKRVLGEVARTPFTLATLAKEGIKGKLGQPTRGIMEVLGDEEMHPQALREIERPKTAGERYAAAGIGGALGGGLTAGGKVTTGALTGLAGGLGSQAGVELAKNQNLGTPYEIGLGLAGGLTAGTVAGMGRSLLPSKGGVAKELLEGLRPADIDAARSVMSAPGQFTIPQALGRSSNFDAMQDVLAGSRHGRATNDLLREQPLRRQAELSAEVGNLPGGVFPTRALANRASDATNDNLREIKSRMTQAWQANADTNQTIPPRKMLQFDKALRAIEESPTEGLVAKERVARIRAALKQDTPNSGQPITGPDGSVIVPAGVTNWNNNVLGLRATIDELLDEFNGNTAGQFGSSARSSGLDKKINALFNDMVEGTPFQQANAAYRRIKVEELDEAKRSIQGAVAGRRGGPEDVNASQGALLRVLDEPVTPGIRDDANEILQLEAALRRQDPQLFPDLVKTKFSQIYSRVAQSPTSRVPENVSARMTQAFGNPLSPNDGNWLRTESMLRGVARSQDLPEDELVKGFRNMLVGASREADRPGSRVMAGLAQGDLETPSASAPIGRIGNFSTIQALRQPALTIARATDAKVLEAFDKAFASREGLEQILSWARQTPDNRLFASMLEGTAGGIGAEVMRDRGIVQPQRR